jgi:transposase
MVIDPLPLTADAHTWQALAHEQHAQLIQTRALIADKEAEIADNEALIAKLKAQIAQLKRLQFTAKAESFSPEQHQLLEDTLAEELASLTRQLEKVLPTEQPAPKQPPKRQPLPAHLPREVIRHEPKTCTCSQCGGELRFIRDEISEQLEYVPARFLVKQHVRPQYSCRQCETVISAPMPMQVIDKALAGPGLLAQVAVSKYADHVPLYRQQQIFARSGIELASSTLAGWMGAIGEVLAPLTHAMHQDLLDQGIIHADETPVQMLDPGRGKTARAYVWLYRQSAAAHAAHFLDGYQGALMVDNYNGYKDYLKMKRL